MSRPPPSVLTEDRLRDMEQRHRQWENGDEVTDLRNERATLIAEVRRLRAGVEWLAQTVHQAHHGFHPPPCAITSHGLKLDAATCTCDAGKVWKDCRRGTCPSVRHVLGDGDVTKEGT